MASPVPDPTSPHAPAYIQDQLQSPWGQVDAHVAEHGPGHLAHQVAGLGQQGQQDLHQHLHPRRLLGGCRRERLSWVREDVPTRPAPGAVTHWQPWSESGGASLPGSSGYRSGCLPAARSSPRGTGAGRGQDQGQAPLLAPLSPSQPGLSSPGAHGLSTQPTGHCGAWEPDDAKMSPHADCDVPREHQDR